MVLEFLLIAALSDGSSHILKNFDDAVVCDDAVGELNQFQRLHETDSDRAMWILMEDAKRDDDSSYKPKPYPAEKYPDPALQVELLINKKLGIESEDVEDLWADVPMLANFDTNVQYSCIATIN